MLKSTLITILVIFAVSCKGPSDQKQKTMNQFNGAKGEVKLIILEPGHFHAALLQKKMYEQIFHEVKVYADEGDGIKSYLALIEQYNTRIDSPTSWKEIVYSGPDFFEKMIADKPGNLLVLAGNNSKKTEYILQSVKNGINVLADKPMVISPDKFPMLLEAFDEAKKNGVLIYDIMTDRHEITLILQKKLSLISVVFGDLQKGTVEEPAIIKENVHHFYKIISGNPLVRPAWYYDVDQQGEGIVDVTTHMVDNIQWACFPGQSIDYSKDIEILSSKRWPTEITPAQFELSTGVKEYPEYLMKNVQNNILKVFANGSITCKIKGVTAKVSVRWDYESKQKGGDTQYSIMRGTNANLIIKQGAEENYIPTLYVEALEGKNLDFELGKAIDEDLQKEYPGLELIKIKKGFWKINIPAKYKIGHEEHFGLVAEDFLKFLVDGKLPDWEEPNMKAKYYTTMEALKKARE